MRRSREVCGSSPFEMNEDLGTDFVGIGLKILQEHIAPGGFHNSTERFEPPKCYLEKL